MPDLKLSLIPSQCLALKYHHWNTNLGYIPKAQRVKSKKPVLCKETCSEFSSDVQVPSLRIRNSEDRLSLKAFAEVCSRVVNSLTVTCSFSCDPSTTFRNSLKFPCDSACC